MESEQRHDESVLDPCYRCGYLIECAVGVRCSECGHVYGTNDVEVSQRRRVSIDGSSRRVRTWMIRWSCIWVVFLVVGLGAMWILDSQMPWDFVYFMVGTLSALIWGSIGLGWVVSRFAPEHQRRLLWLGWLEALPVVHLSWLSIAGFAGLESVLAGVLYFLGVSVGGGKYLDIAEMVITGSVIIAFVVWTLGSLALLFAWPAKLSEYLLEHEVVKCQPGEGMMWFLGVVTYLAACAVGFMGGVLWTGFIINLMS